MGCTEWIEMNQKNKPQGNSLAGGILTVIATGMVLAPSLIDTFLQHQPWTFDNSDAEVLLTILSFHIAAVVGSFAGCYLVERYPKKKIYWVLITFATIGSVILIAAPDHIVAVAFARVLFGIAHGMAFLVTVVHGGEVIIKEMRGTIISSIGLCIMSGVLLGSTFAPGEELSLSPNQLVGIIAIVEIVLGAFLNLVICYESPVYLAQRSQDRAAIESMMKLRNESVETWEIRNELTEIKAMLVEDANTSRSIFQDGNIRPLVLIALAKIASVMSFNYAVNSIKFHAIYQALEFSNENVNLAAVIMVSIRVLVGMVVLFLVDTIGRRPFQLLSGISAGLVMTVMGIVYLATTSISAEVTMAVFFVCDVGASLGIVSIPAVYCSEAFNTKKKALSIAVVQTVENVLHIVIFAITFWWDFTDVGYYGGVLLTAGLVLLALEAVLYQTLPETSKMSIRQARTEFYKRDGIVFGGSKNSLEVLYD